MCVCVCVCIEIRGEMDKSDTHKEFSCDISFFIQEFLQTIYFLSFPALNI